MTNRATNVDEEKDPDEEFIQKEFEAGRLGYYHAHNKKPKEDLSNVKVIEGKGLANLSGVIKLDPEDERYEERFKDNDVKLEYMRDHQFADEKEKVRVYLDVTPEMMKDGVVNVEIEKDNLTVEIVTSTKKLCFAVADQRLHSEVIPEASSWRINSSKTKIAITLRKKETEYWPQLVKKQMNQHTGWQ